MSGGVIEIEVQLTVDDYTDFSTSVNYDFKKRRNFFSALFFNFLLGLYGAGLAAVIMHGIFFLSGKTTFPQVLYDILTTVFSPGLFFILFIITSLFYFFPRLTFFKACIRSTTKKRYASGRNLVPFALTTMRINESKVSSSSQYHYAEYLWNGIEKVDITEGNLHIFVSSLSAFVIPARFFKSEEEKQRVYEQCLKWWQVAQQQTPESGAV
ncbi:MAG: YcxB family protein [Alphaproteobacteria bacterium]|nr:YcxB family protein [Alphaproteobacteria bacterium]MBP7759275.1 YcxB family protein [Alphaproteobacteria bacterium]MBP7761909.1 YcxB family protein [Alphaproteobacteria bacterium]MBP7906139.1 YcxB family protein [Alphaproteobacteria bacterium]